MRVDRQVDGLPGAQRTDFLGGCCGQRPEKAENDGPRATADCCASLHGGSPFLPVRPVYRHHRVSAQDLFAENHARAGFADVSVAEDAGEDGVGMRRLGQHDQHVLLAGKELSGLEAPVADAARITLSGYIVCGMA